MNLPLGIHVDPILAHGDGLVQLTEHENKANRLRHHMCVDIDLTPNAD